MTVAEPADPGWIVQAPPRLRRWARLRGGVWPSVGVSVVLMLLTWRPQPLSASPGLDPSWEAGLHMGAHLGLAWGTQFIYTYGPLGFLTVPTYYYGLTGALALLYTAVIAATMLGLLWAALRPRVGPVWAFLILLVTGRIVQDPAPIVGLGLAVWYLQATPLSSRRRDLLALGAIGAFGGFELLLKINYGVAVIIVTAFAAVLADGSLRMRAARLVVVGGSALLTFLAWWLILGQPLDAVVDFFHNAGRTVAGYSASAEYEDPVVRWEYSAALAVMVCACIASFTSVEVRARRVLLVFLAFAFFFFKEGFVRHDYGHGVVFFTTVLFAAMFLAWRGTPRQWTIVAIGFIYVVCLASSLHGFDDFLTPWKSTRSSLSQLSTLVRPGRRGHFETEGRNAVLGADAIAPRTAALLGRGTVWVWPSEESIVWALKAKWDPLPVIQTLQVVTPGLDDINARALSGSGAPKRVLVGAGQQVEGRFDAFDAPKTAQALLCNYRVEYRQAPTWVVLMRRQNRCGPMREIGSVRAAWGQGVLVPKPPTSSSIVMARVAGVQVTGLEKLRGLVFKPYTRFVTLDGTANVHRLSPATSGDGMVVAASPSVDVPPPLNLAPNPKAMTFTREAQPTGGTPLRVDFYAMDVGR